MQKYGICNYNFNSYEPKVENLEIFNTYDEAYTCYKKRIYEDKSYLIPENLWCVFIESDPNIDNGKTKIIQFDRFERKTKCKMVDSPIEINY